MLYYYQYPKKVTAKHLMNLVTKNEEEINDLIPISNAMWQDFAQQLVNDTNVFSICQKHMSTSLTTQMLLSDPEGCYNDFISGMSTEVTNNYADYHKYYPILMQYLANAINKYK